MFVGCLGAGGRGMVRHTLDAGKDGRVPTRILRIPPSSIEVKDPKNPRHFLRDYTSCTYYCTLRLSVLPVGTVPVLGGCCSIILRIPTWSRRCIAVTPRQEGNKQVGVSLCLCRLSFWGNATTKRCRRRGFV